MQNQKLPVQLNIDDEYLKSIITHESEAIKSLSKSSEINISDEKPSQALSSVVKGIEVFVVLEGAVDVEAEKERLEKEAKRLEGQIFGINKKLSNEKFVNNAPEQVVEMERKKLADMNENLEKIKEQISGL